MVRLQVPGVGALEAILDEPRASSRRAVVVCHPHPAFGGRMSTPLMAELASAFVEAGWAALRFHYRGIEGSEGTATGGLREHEDVAAALAFLESAGKERVALCGYSFGALMSLRAIARGARPSGCVSIALPTAIIRDDPARIDEIARAGRLVPLLHLAGTQDPLCDLERLRRYTADTPAVVEELAGEGHAFSLAGTRAILRRCRAFLAEAN
jgi:alpha/beta superfamily hydrolase